MSPRRKQVLDNDVLDHVAALLLERGAQGVTFAEVAKRCGLAPPTLVQRFRSRDVMLAGAGPLLRERVTAVFHAASQAQPPLAALRAALQELARLALVNALDAGTSNEIRKQISYLLAAAIERSELPRCEIASLARVIQIGFYGSVIAGSAESIDVSAEVDAALSAQLASYI